jgi:pimeloyl-ACP methyl ester carboxylesterase
MTLYGLSHPAEVTPAGRDQAYADVLAAWRSYLADDNHGRGVVLIGHSQGAIALAQLITSEVDKNAAVRRRLVSALLLGGQVTTAESKDTGGSFTVIPACRRPGQVGCVVGYSSFASEPPPTAPFGRAQVGRQVLCTEPSRLAGGTGLLHPYLPADRVGGGSGFVAYPDSLTGTCHHADGASWLQIARTPGSRIPQQPEQLGRDWGLHVGDVNLALGDLLEVVRRQSAAWH